MNRLSTATYRSRLPRWQRWLNTAVTPVLLTSMLLPLMPQAPVLAASSDPGLYGSTLADAQQVPPDQATTPNAASDKSYEDLTPEDLFGQPIYEVVKAEWDKTFKPTSGVSITIPATSYSAADVPALANGKPGLQPVDNFQGRSGPALLWANDDGWVEWQFDIPQAGFYEIDAEYYPIVPTSCDGCIDKRASVQRDLFLDGQLPFREAKRIVFQRVWKDSFWPPKRDNQGNDVRPPQIETPQWEIKTLEDADGRYETPFQFAFTAGRHTLRLNTVREGIGLGNLIIRSPKVIPTYAERLQEWKAKGYKEVTADQLRQLTPDHQPYIKFEAEEMFQKSDPTIRGEVSFDALAEPYSDGLFRLNSFGGWRWRLAGQWARWKFSVPADGLYRINMSVWQGWSGRRARIRRLRIDGEYPFREMTSILFRMERDWRMETMRKEQLASGEPYLFYLTKGDHMLQMEMTLGFMAETVRVLDQSLSEMSVLSREMLMVTGTHPDPNMEWDLHEKIPNLLPRLQAIVDRLEDQAKRMEDISHAKNDASSAFRVVEDQVQTMVRRPHDMHRMIDDFERSQGILAAWLLNLQNHPLQIDYFLIGAPDTKLPRVRANVFEQTSASIKTFVMSFFRDYTGLGSVYKKGGSDKPLEVWVGRGTEWGQIMKDMVEDDFTPNTGIKINIHVIPPASLGEGAGSVLLLATTAGEAPDVAVGVPSQLPVDFAVRKGLVDLSSFPDYPQVAQRFRPGALIPFRYKVKDLPGEGNWAIPETQNFAMLFYRIDVLQELGIKAPDTWEEVYDALLKLQQNGLDFYYPPPTGVAVTEGSVGFTPFLFQNGGDYYKCDSEACRSALTSPEALAGFQEWTDLYSNYKIPREANFFTRMRTGEQPIGVSNYNTYISLSVAAPELTGRWEMRPMPGHRCGQTNVQTGQFVPCPAGVQPGTVIRTSGGTGESMVIFQQSKNKEGAWEFLKWWSSKESQQRFGGELEALIGVEARWNTANLAALQSLPWPKRDIASIMEQWSYFREPPVVLGGYFTGRHVLNAWNKVVLQGTNPREALEDAVYDINKELATKQEEFGIKVDPSMYRRGG